MSIHNEDVKEQKRQKTMELQKEQKKELAQKFSKVFKTLIKEDLEEKTKNGYPYYEQNIYENIGISKGAFNSYKNGDDGKGKNANPKVPNFVALYKIKKYFNVPYSYLFGETLTKNINNIADGTKFGLDDKSISVLEELQSKASIDNIEENYSSIMKLYVINSFIHNERFLDDLSFLVSTIIGRNQINKEFEKQLLKIDDKHFEYMKYSSFIDYLNYFENASSDDIPKYIIDNSREIAKKYSGHYQTIIDDKK